MRMLVNKFLSITIFAACEGQSCWSILLYSQWQFCLLYRLAGSLQSRGNENDINSGEKACFGALRVV